VSARGESQTAVVRSVIGDRIKLIRGKPRLRKPGVQMASRMIASRGPSVSWSPPESSLVVRAWVSKITVQWRPVHTLRLVGAGPKLTATMIVSSAVARS
jgi:hypothetical protein